MRDAPIVALAPPAEEAAGPLENETHAFGLHLEKCWCVRAGFGGKQGEQPLLFFLQLFSVKGCLA